jgi:hypothetical protein
MRLWPEPLRTGSLPFFDFQGVYLNFWFNTDVRSLPDIEKAHALLTQSSLRTLVLLLLGSDSDIQHVVSSANPQALASPLLQYHLGIRLISERNYSAAVDPLGRAEQNPQVRQNAFRLRIYALCMSGQTRLAQELAQKQMASLLNTKGLTGASLKEANLPPYWLWMKKTFGIDPLKGAPDSQSSSPATSLPP